MQSLSIIQIEELVYGRLNHVSKTDWIAMLKKHGAHADYITFKDNYFLLEQSDYRFEGNKMISSERVVYNIDYATYDTAENAPDPENTDEIQIVRYDRRTDRYFVRYAHYLPSNNSVPSLSTLLSDICSEADIPSTRQAVQAPAEKHIDTPVTPRSAQPAPQPKPEPAPTPSFSSTEYHKPWRQKRLAQLMAYYKQGYTAKEIAAEMECLESSVYYQLENYLNVPNPFQKGWISRQEAAEKERKREESYTTHTPSEVVPQDHKPKKGVEYYKDLFKNMRRAKNEFGERAPHKVILLLTIIRRYHSYTGYTINKDINLQLSFMDCWTKYVQSSHWNPNLNMPWEHMQSEPFWYQASDPKQATIDLQLQKLIIDKESRKELKDTLVSML